MVVLLPIIWEALGLNPSRIRKGIQCKTFYVDHCCGNPEQVAAKIVSGSLYFEHLNIEVYDDRNCSVFYISI